MFFSANELIKFSVRGNDDDIGPVKDFLFDDRLWAVRYMVADTNKWLPASRKVVLSPIAFGRPDLDKNEIPVALSREEIKNCPPLDEHKPVSRQYEAAFFKYFGYSYYWMGPHLWGSYPQPAPLSDTEIREQQAFDKEQDTNLRSVKEIIGYDIQAKDDNIGHVEDFIFDDKTWEIAHLVVNTRNWWPGGRDVLVSPRSIEKVSWNSHSLRVDLTADDIKNGEEVDPSALHRPGYQTLLRSHQRSKFTSK